MAENSGIEWTNHTFNPWRGCTKVSPGCAHCYAETLSGRNPKTLGMWGSQGTRVVAAEAQWRLPLKWNKAAKESGRRDRVFCASLADVFEDWTGRMTDSQGRVFWWEEDDKTLCVTDTEDDGQYRNTASMDDFRNRLFRLIDDTPNLNWLLLTKRPQNIIRMMHYRDKAEPWPRPNVWLGVSVENQKCADERIPLLLQAPAAVRFLSCEPLLGPLQFSDVSHRADAVKQLGKRALSGIHWVIVGGESGPHARPMHPDWARSVRDQCQAAGVPFFFKQHGGWAEVGRPTDADEVVQISVRSDRWVNRAGGSVHTDWDTVGMNKVGKKVAGRLLDGVEYSEFPVS